MKTTLLAIALAVASVPLTFAQVKPAPSAAGSSASAPQTTKKSTAKKGSKKSTAKKSVTTASVKK